MKVLQDIAQLSSGTMATLTGQRLYEVIDRIRSEFFQWASARILAGHTFETWVDAWNEYKATGVTCT